MLTERCPALKHTSISQLVKERGLYDDIEDGCYVINEDRVCAVCAVCVCVCVCVVCVCVCVCVCVVLCLCCVCVCFCACELHCVTAHIVGACTSDSLSVSLDLAGD
jgi:hypothetical protein